MGDVQENSSLVADSRPSGSATMDFWDTFQEKIIFDSDFFHYINPVGV